MTDGKSTKEAVSLKIYESAEDYLEKILMLTERNGEVRSIDIATEMGVTKPSVSIAMKNLRQAGYISGNCYPDLWPPQKADPLFCCTGCGPYRCFPRCLQDRA